MSCPQIARRPCLYWFETHQRFEHSVRSQYSYRSPYTLHTFDGNEVCVLTNPATGISRNSNESQVKKIVLKVKCSQRFSFLNLFLKIPILRSLRSTMNTQEFDRFVLPAKETSGVYGGVDCQQETKS